jgi:Sec-independent protein translocase protein TatA
MHAVEDIVLGPRTLPEAACGIGRGIREVKDASTGHDDDLATAVDAVRSTTATEHPAAPVSNRAGDSCRTGT